MNRLFEIVRDNAVHRLDETALPLLIGGGAKAHLRLDDTPEIVAYVAESRGHLFLQPADNAPQKILYHNDEALIESVWVKSGDVTRIGEAVIRWHVSGQRVEMHVSKVSEALLRPPTAPPEGLGTRPGGRVTDEHTLPVVDLPKRALGRPLLILAMLLFALLVAGAAFVLLANPLAVLVTPPPDLLSVSGFPPPVKFGDRYLGLPGSYTLRAVKEGYLPLEKTIEIGSAGSHYSFTLEKMPGLVDLDSTPDGATVLIDGVRAGLTPLQDVPVPAGVRAVRFEHKLYLPAEHTLDIKGLGARQSLRVALEPAWATVSLQTEPAGAALTIDGEVRGETPLQLDLGAGTHQLLFSKEKFTPLTVELSVAAGQDLSPATFRLEAAPSALAITSTPAGATITVDGTYQGQTPLTVVLKPGREHDLRLNLAGHLPAHRRLKVEPAEQRDLAISLEPEYGTVFIVGTPAGAQLYIDGKRQESTTGRFRLTTREHTLELRAENQGSMTRTVIPQAGYSQRIELDLSRKQAEVAAPSGPAQLRATGLGQKLRLITPTSFLMGASRQDAGRRANESERTVAMQRSFYLSEREVTNAEYRLFNAQHSSGVSGNRSLEVDNHPVVNVSWDDAARFLNWLSVKDGLPPYYREEHGRITIADERGPGYRLPTEAEWAFAARMAGRKERARYPWDGKFPPPANSGNFADESARHILPQVIEGYSDGFAATAPTGSFPANPAGFYDLGGNVAEWCHDYYAANPTGSGTEATDPTGPASGAHHAVRGSSWRDASLTELRFSYRRYSREPASDIGFRIARYAQ